MCKQDTAFFLGAHIQNLRESSVILLPISGRWAGQNKNDHTSRHKKDTWLIWSFLFYVQQTLSIELTKWELVSNHLIIY